MGFVDITVGELSDVSIVETPQAVDLDDFFSMAPMKAKVAAPPALDDTKAWQKTLQLGNPSRQSLDEMLKSKGTKLLLHVISQPAPQVTSSHWHSSKKSQIIITSTAITTIPHHHHSPPSPQPGECP